jgi:fibronectin-binding autotransporter adhesin
VTSWVAASASFTGLTTGDLCTAASGTAIACASTLSGDVTSAGGTATATTVAKIQGTTVSGTTGSTNVVFSASPTLTGTITAAAATFSGAVTMSPASANIAISPTGTGTVTISPAGALTINPTAASTINNTSIGATTASTGGFTTVAASGAITDTQSIGATSTNGLVLTNTTAAALGAQQWSPRVHFDGRGWETGTSASQAVDMIEELQPVQGATNPSGNLTWSSSINGGAYGTLMTLTTGGNFGIGTTGPGQALQVVGQIGVAPSGTTPETEYNGDLVVEKPAATGQYINLIRSGTAVWSIGTVYNSTTFAIGTGNATDSSFTSPAFNITTGGNVGIGSASPGAVLDIVGNSTNTAANYFAERITGAQSTANTNTYFGMNINPTYTAASGNTLAGFAGLQILPNNTNTGTVTTMYGVYNNPQNSSSGTVTTMYGDYVVPSNTSGGTVGNIYGVVSTPGKGSTGVVTTLTSLFARCDNDNATGVVTTCYDLYLATPTLTGAITNNYGVYQQYASAINYFAGDVGIGTTSPPVLLSVAGTPGAPATSGTSQANANLRLQSNNPGTDSSVIDMGIYLASPYGGWMQATNSNALGSTFPLVLQPVGGNVGIGTTSPDGTFTIEDAGIANVTFKNSSGATEAYLGLSAIDGSASTNELRIRGDAGILFSVAGSPKMTINTSGSVGIGTTGPATLLHVNGIETVGLNGGTGGQITLNGATSGSVALEVAAAAGTGTVFQLPATNGTANYYLQTNGSGVTSWAAGTLPALASTDVWVGNGSNVATATATTGTGNVVMSTSPTLTGTVSGASSTWAGVVAVNALQMGSLNVGGASRATLVADFPGINTGGAAAFAWNYTSGGGETDMFINRDGGGTGGLNIYDFPDTSGNPTSILTLTGSGNLTIPGTEIFTGGNVTLNNATSNTIFFGNVGVAVPGSGSVGEKIQLYGTAGTVAASDYALGIQGSNMWFNTGGGFLWDVSGTTYMTMLSSGYVGIGTTSPARPLHILVSDSGTATPAYPLRLAHATSGTAANNLGTAIEFAVQNPSGSMETIGSYTGQRWADTSGTSTWWEMDMMTGGVMSNGNITGGHDPIDWGTWEDSSHTAGTFISEIDLTSIGNEQPYIDLYRANGTQSALTTVANGNVLGAYEWNGYDGTGMHTSARIMGVVNGTVATNSIPTDITFNTGVTTGGTEKMRITSGGNVGIGTTGPGYPLDIEDPTAGYALNIGNVTVGSWTGLNINSDGVLTDMQSIQSSGLGEMGTESNNGLIIRTNATERVRILAGGNVGIGSTTPGETLDVSGIIRSNSDIISSAAGADGANIRMIGGNYGAFFRNDGANTYFLLTASGSQYSSWNTLRPFTVADSTGYVTMANGVGVTGGFTTDTLTATGLFYASGGLEFPENSWMYAPGGVSRNLYISATDMYWEVGGTGDFHFRNSSDADLSVIAGATGRSTYFDAGNVGIGSAVPAAPLDVEGSSTNTTTQYINALVGGVQSTANTSTYYGLKTAPAYTAASGNTLAGLVGITNAPANSSTGTVTALYGDYTAPLNNSSGTVGSMYGVLSIPTKASTGVVTTMYGLYSRCDNKNATGAVTTCYDLYLDTPTLTGAITNNYGVYQTYASATNYFAGNVGIGSTVPGEPLDVSGIVRTNSTFVSTLGGGAQFRGIDGNYGWFDYSDGTNFYFLLTASGSQYGSYNSLRPLYINEATGMVNMNNGLTVGAGQLGVGMAPISGAPADIFDAGDLNIGLGSGSAVTLSFNLYYNGGWKYGATGYGSAIRTDGSGNMAFFNTASSGSAGAAAAPSQDMVILAGGNVGIGTTVPGALLNVKYGTNVDSGSQPSGTFASIVYNATNLTGQNGLFVKNNWANSASTVLEVGNDFVTGAYTSYLHVGGDGHVGIGTAAPATVLNVYGPYSLPSTSGSTATDTTLRINNSTGGATGAILDMGQAGTAGSWLQSRLATNYATNYPILLNPNGGYVGIGTSTMPTGFSLAVYSSSTTSGILGSSSVGHGIVGTTTVGGSTFYGGSFSSGSYSAGLARADGYAIVGTGNGWFTATLYDSDSAVHSSSDRRLKTNIVPVDGMAALETIGKLNPVLFRWRNPSLHDNHAESGGFIAQEMQQIFPHTVTELPCTGADCELVGGGKELTIGLGLEYQAYIVKALQQLKSMFDSDHGDIAKLKTLFDGDHEKIEQLKAANDDLHAANDNEAAQIKALTARLDAIEHREH